MGEYILAVLAPPISAFVNKRLVWGILLTIAVTISMFVFWVPIWAACAIVASIIVYTKNHEKAQWRQLRADQVDEEVEKMIKNARG